MNNSGLVVLLIIIIVLFYFSGYTVDNFEVSENKSDNEMNPVDVMHLTTPENTLEEDLAGVINDQTSVENNTFANPLLNNINRDRDDIAGVDQSALQSLIREVNTGNDIPDNSARADLFRSKTDGIDHAKNYRNVSYADSNYRMDFNGDGMSQPSQDKLDGMFDQALVFQNSEFSENSNFGPNPGSSGDFGPANLGDFSHKSKSQQEKLMNMFNSNNYLPNSNKTDSSLEKGFQILENPVSVDNPNLIPVQRSIPVSSTMGNSRNSSRDIRGDIPNPKSVVSPWQNSSINPDIYSSNRGCL
jgi:hypothetical protein